ncbi:hypothetical protein AOB60_23985 [Streptomyces noursei]|uniref:Uncharacterized protein n=1 Tax=Streptomyces noursei TaxID=1971 RepID=A0A2N8P8P2_STRNR|nr:hypothetical protein AOB60_23985 [Streptomyces noursei]
MVQQRPDGRRVACVPRGVRGAQPVRGLNKDARRDGVQPAVTQGRQHQGQPARAHLGRADEPGVDDVHRAVRHRAGPLRIAPGQLPQCRSGFTSAQCQRVDHRVLDGSGTVRRGGRAGAHNCRRPAGLRRRAQQQAQCGAQRIGRFAPQATAQLRTYVGAVGIPTQDHQQPEPDRGIGGVQAVFADRRDDRVGGSGRISEHHRHHASHRHVRVGKPPEQRRHPGRQRPGQLLRPRADERPALSFRHAQVVQQGVESRPAPTARLVQIDVEVAVHHGLPVERDAALTCGFHGRTA